MSQHISREIEEAARAAAIQFGLEPALVLAIVDVESGGEPFEAWSLFTDRKTPRFLFERHIFYRRLPEAKRHAAVIAGLANREWQKTKQYRDQRSSKDRIAIMRRAVAFAGEEVAFRSASWGLMQTMGFNFNACGFGSAVGMVETYASIKCQIEGALTYIRSAGLLEYATRREWAVFAEGYNGHGYRANQYDTRLAESYRTFSA